MDLEPGGKGDISESPPSFPNPLHPHYDLTEPAESPTYITARSTRVCGLFASQRINLFLKGKGLALLVLAPPSYSMPSDVVFLLPLYANSLKAGFSIFILLRSVFTLSLFKITLRQVFRKLLSRRFYSNCSLF